MFRSSETLGKTPELLDQTLLTPRTCRLHINDPDGDFYHVVFSGTAVRDKNPYEIAQFGTSDTGFGTSNSYSKELHFFLREFQS